MRCVRLTVTALVAAFAAVPSVAAADGVAGRIFTVAGPVGGAKDIASVAAMSDGGFLFLERDFDTWAIRRVAPTGAISTVAQGSSFSGAASQVTPGKIAALPSGGFLLPDSSFGRVFAATLDGRMTRLAGTGVPGVSGDGGPAIAAALATPVAAVPARNGGVLIADQGASRIRRRRSGRYQLDGSGHRRGGARGGRRSRRRGRCCRRRPMSRRRRTVAS